MSGLVISDRDAQRRILEALATTYPNGHPSLSETAQVSSDDLKVHAAYLSGHGLISLHGMGDAMPTYVGLARRTSWVLTEVGYDFILADGGLTKILKTVTVRFDEQQFRDLLIAMVRDSEAEASLKDRIIGKIQDLPADGVKACVVWMLKKGMAAAPSTISLVAKYFGVGS